MFLHGERLTGRKRTKSRGRDELAGRDKANRNASEMASARPSKG
jgi:hypothetical protein